LQLFSGLKIQDLFFFCSSTLKEKISPETEIKNNQILLHVPVSGAALEHTSLYVKVVTIVFVLTLTSDSCFRP